MLTPVGDTIPLRVMLGLLNSRARDRQGGGSEEVKETLPSSHFRHAMGRYHYAVAK